MRHVDEIIIHCTATHPEWWADKNTDQKRDEIKRWHVAGNGWSDIGYHHLIDRDGTLIEGRPMNRDGAHTRGHNKGTIGVSLFGGHGSSENDEFSDNFTPAQDAALRRYITQMKQIHPGIQKVSGHNEYAAKACPGFNVKRWLAEKPAERSTPLQSTTIQATVGAGVTGATGAVTAISALDGTAQLVVVGAACVAALFLLWIFKERIRKWKAGDR
jgi:N-acetylmuramoyl-L-alanine amidase